MIKRITLLTGLVLILVSYCPVKLRATTPLKPDLIISEFTATRGESLVIPLRVNIHIRTKNQGHAGTGSQHFVTRLSYRIHSTDPYQFLHDFLSDPLSIGVGKNNDLTCDFTESGTYSFKAEVDADKVIAESSEGNNIKYVSGTFAAGTPDLAVENLTASSVNVYTSGNWTVKTDWDVKNIGDGKAVGSFIVLLRVYKDNDMSGSDLQSYTKYSLEKGASSHFTRTTTFTNINKVHFKVIADSTLKIHERSEANNTVTSNTLTK